MAASLMNRKVQMKEVIEKLERILELTNSHGICINGTGKFATEESQLEHVESKIRLNAIQALTALDSAHIDSEKKPRTKVDYVRCEFCDIHSHIDGLTGGIYQRLSDGDYSELTHIADLFCYKDELYRRIETPMTEREAFIDGYEKLIDGFMGDETKIADDWAGYVFDKLVSQLTDSRKPYRYDGLL